MSILQALFVAVAVPVLGAVAIVGYRAYTGIELSWRSQHRAGHGLAWCLLACVGVAIIGYAAFGIAS